MRQGPNTRRSRGRGPRKPHVSTKQQTFDSNGPDIRVRGNAYQVLEKYLAMARDATSAGDRIAAENYLQHAEHYYRLINANTDHHGQNGRPRPMGRMDPNGHDAPGGLPSATQPLREEAGDLANGSDEDSNDDGRGGST